MTEGPSSRVQPALQPVVNLNVNDPIKFSTYLDTHTFFTEENVGSNRDEEGHQEMERMAI